MSRGYITYSSGGGNSLLMTTKVSLSSAQILTLNTIPVQLLPAPGAGLYYDVVDCIGFYTFGGTAYATNINFSIVYNNLTSNLALFSNSALINQTANRKLKFAAGTITGSLSAYSTNAPLVAQVATGNPTAGNGTVDIYLLYDIVTA